MATGLFYAELLDQFDAELPKKRSCSTLTTQGYISAITTVNSLH